MSLANAFTRPGKAECFKEIKCVSDSGKNRYYRVGMSCMVGSIKESMLSISSEAMAGLSCQDLVLNGSLWSTPEDSSLCDLNLDL
jgi:hypothetical protein